MTNSGVTKMAGDGSLMGAAVPPQAVVRGLPGWLTPLLQSTALVLVLLGLAFASLPIYLCVPLALLVIWLPRLKKPALSLSSSDAADAIGDLTRKSPSTNNACISRLLTAKETPPHRKKHRPPERAARKNGRNGTITQHIL
jgi:hypothetical protein